MKLAIVLLGWIWGISAGASEFTLPTESQRLSIFSRLTSEMERLDAIALQVRTNRPQSWKRTLNQLRREVRRATTPQALILAFYRLDAAYPNLHSSFELGTELQKYSPTRIRPRVRFDAEWRELNRSEFKVSRVDPLWSGPSTNRPNIGDQIVAINGRKISDWSDENLDFCKRPLRGQCDAELASNLQKELLSWNRTQPLKYRIRRESREWEITVPIEDLGARPPRDPKALECAREPLRYPNFKLTYAGNRACVYESETDSESAILRITAFQYRLLTPEQTIKSVPQEVRRLKSWWLEHARWKHLVIDLIDNGGGNSPVPYYQILLNDRFQIPLVQIKKIPELSDEKIRRAMFWEEAAQEIWFQKLKKSGVFDQIAQGSFLPPVASGCADDTKDCNDSWFEPLEHSFKGRVSLMINEYCVSACDEFVWLLKDQMGDKLRLFGHPQAADGAYSRLTIGVLNDPESPDGFKTEIRPIRTEASQPSLFSQTVAVSKTVDSQGQTIDGVPLALDGFVPWQSARMNQWHQDVLKAALDSR